ncbi:MAG TPA: hypothetical protein PLR02_03165 [Rhodocyclaceae bacterium]|nr:hypothetical protein [Rhodocyclaceae bacterium]
MKSESKTCRAGSEVADFPGVKPACAWRMRFVAVAGLVMAGAAMFPAPALAEAANPGVAEIVGNKRPKAERHMELRKVLSAPQEVGTERDGRRKLSAEERNALRESMRGVYDGREPREERGFKPRP